CRPPGRGQPRQRPGGSAPAGHYSSAVRLILVRHAKAAPGSPDASRPLTPAGHEAAALLAIEIRDLGPDAVISSPLLRARETAGPIAEAAGVELELDPRLAPGATLYDIRA